MTKRTSQQNRALWKYLTWLADTLNDAGLDQRKVLKPSINIPWTKNAAHDQIWIPIQKAMYGTDSTTKLTKTGQIENIHKVIMRELGEKHGVEYIEFPSEGRMIAYEDTAPMKESYSQPTSIVPPWRRT